MYLVTFEAGRIYGRKEGGSSTYSTSSQLWHHFNCLPSCIQYYQNKDYSDILYRLASALRPFTIYFFMPPTYSALNLQTDGGLQGEGAVGWTGFQIAFTGLESHLLENAAGYPLGPIGMAEPYQLLTFSSKHRINQLHPLLDYYLHFKSMECCPTHDPSIRSTGLEDPSLLFPFSRKTRRESPLTNLFSQESEGGYLCYESFTLLSLQPTTYGVEGLLLGLLTCLKFSACSNRSFC